MQSQNSNHCIIPLELCMEILSYLPVKSLLRFRSVSKDWKSTIANSQFSFLHLSRYSANCLDSHLLLFENDMETRLLNGNAWCFNVCTVIEPSSHQQTSKFNLPIPLAEVSCVSHVIHGNMDGVFLVESIWRRGNNKLIDVILWNPSIRKIVKLPQPSLRPVGAMVFGFDPLTTDYKVVNLIPLKGKQQQSLEIFSRRSSLWKKGSTFSFDDGMIYVFGYKLSLGGSVYWVGGFPRDHRKFVSINLSSETLSSTSLPNLSAYKPCSTVAYPVAVAGSLVGLLTSCRGKIDIWVLKRWDGCLWSKTYTMDRFSLNLTPFHLTKDHVFIFWRSLKGKEEPEDEPTHVTYAYDTIAQRERIVSESGYDWWPYHIGPHVQSLLLLSC